MPKPLPIEQALEFAAPSTTVPCFEPSERQGFADELRELGRDHPYNGFEADVADINNHTLNQLAQHLAAPDYEIITGNGGMSLQRRSTANAPLVRRFLYRGAKHFAKELGALRIERARMQVINDRADNPYNAGGFTAHTDREPSWDRSKRRRGATLRLSIAVCSIDPGTVTCRLNRPLEHSSPIAKIMRAKVRRNHGPHPKLFMRAVRQSRGAAELFENRGGDASTFNGDSVHWRSHEGRNKPSGYRAFAVLDLYIPRTPQNERLIRAVMAKQKRPSRMKLAKITPRPRPR